MGVSWAMLSSWGVSTAADGTAHHPRRPRNHRTRTDRHPGRRRRPPGQRPSDSRRAVVPGRHLPAPHPPRRDRLPHLAARAGAYPRQGRRCRSAGRNESVRSGPDALRMKSREAAMQNDGGRRRRPPRMARRLIPRRERLDRASSPCQLISEHHWRQWPHDGARVAGGCGKPARMATMRSVPLTHAGLAEAIATGAYPELSLEVVALQDLCASI